MPPHYHAFIDEAGDRARTAKSSDHFVVSAIIVEANDLPQTAYLLSQLRADLGRHPGDTLHWKNIKGHSSRLHAAQVVGAAGFLTISSVVVCKRHLAGQTLDEETAYMFTFRMLLERLTWFAAARGATIEYTLAHIVRFKLATLRHYEAVLKTHPTEIRWPTLPKLGALDQPTRVQQLQLADLAASATFPAFEADHWGNTTRLYLEALAPRLYRRPSGALTSYGMKMHPWNAAAKAAYQWVPSL